MSRAIIVYDGVPSMTADLLARIELREANAWLLLRSLVEMLGA